MEKKEWKDIPSLEGLEVDWGFKAESKLGKRAHARLMKSDFASLLDSESVPVKVATAQKVLNGTIHDLCEGGLAVDIKEELALLQAVRIGFFLGAEKIIAQAQVKHVCRVDGCYRTGLQFSGLDQSARKYILELYASRVLKHAL